jgi:hypothetical protein
MKAVPPAVLTHAEAQETGRISRKINERQKLHAATELSRAYDRLLSNVARQDR